MGGGGGGRVLVEVGEVGGGGVGGFLGVSFAVLRFPGGWGVFFFLGGGGFRWMQKGRGFFDRHIAFVREHGLAAAAERAKATTNFWHDPEAGPWAAVSERQRSRTT